jgi:hypothetical protein
MVKKTRMATRRKIRGGSKSGKSKTKYEDPLAIDPPPGYLYRITYETNPNGTKKSYTRELVEIKKVHVLPPGSAVSAAATAVPKHYQSSSAPTKKKKKSWWHFFRK